MSERSNRAPKETVWFITGCSTGIGKWLSSTAYEAGHFVVATSRDTSKLTHLPSDVPAVLKLQLDVNSPVSISKCIEATLDHFGCIDVLVNNAGYGLFGDTEGVHDHLAREAFETNFWGPVSLTKEMVRVFRDVNPKGRGGAVIQISSFGGWIGYPGGAFYYASKFALEGFTESISREMHPDWNIKFLILEPGGVQTEFAGSNLVLSDRHPAYLDPRCPYNEISALLSSSDLKSTAWADAKDTAKVVFDLVEHRDIRPWPLRLPLGSDAVKLIQKDISNFENDMAKWAIEIRQTPKKKQQDSEEYQQWTTTLSRLSGHND